MNKILIFSILFILILGKIDSHSLFCTNEGCKTMKLEHEIYSSNKPYAGTQDLPFVLNEDPKKFVVLLLLNTTVPIDCPLGDSCNDLSSVNEALPPNLFDASNLTDLVEAKIDPYQYIRSATSSNETGQIWKPFIDFKLGDFHKKQLPHSDLAVLLLMTLAAMVFDHLWALIFIVCFIELVIFEKHHKIQAKRYKEANKEIINIRENRCSKYTNKFQQHTVKNTAKTEDDNRTSTLKTTQKNEAKENAKLNMLDSTKCVEIIHETDNAVRETGIITFVAVHDPTPMEKTAGQEILKETTKQTNERTITVIDETPQQASADCILIKPSFEEQDNAMETVPGQDHTKDNSPSPVELNKNIEVEANPNTIIAKEMSASMKSDVLTSQDIKANEIGHKLMEKKLLEERKIEPMKSKELLQSSIAITDKTGAILSTNSLVSSMEIKVKVNEKTSFVMDKKNNSKFSQSKRPEILPKEPVISEVTESQEDTRLLQQDEVQTNKIENNTKISNKCDSSVNELKSTARIKILSRKPEILPKEPVISEVTESQEDTRLLQQDEVQTNKIENDTKISNNCDSSVNELKSTARIKILSRKPEILPKEPVISEVTESQEDTRLLQQDEVQTNKIENNTKISNNCDSSVNELKSTARIKILSRKPEILPKEPVISEVTESQEDTHLLQQDEVQTNKIENDTKISNNCDSSVNELKSTARIKILSRKPEILAKEPVISEVTESQEDTRLLQQDEVQTKKIENDTKISNNCDSSVNELKSTATIKILSRKPEILPKEPVISEVTESQEDTRLLQQDEVQTKKIENDTKISNNCDSSVNELKSTAGIKILSRKNSKNVLDQIKRKRSSETKKVNFLTQSEKEKKSIGYGWVHKKLFQRKKQKSTKRKPILSEMMRSNFLSTNPLVDGEDLIIYLKGNTFSIIFENDENDSKCESVAINEIPVNNENLETTLSSNLTNRKNQTNLTTSSPRRKQEISNTNESFRKAGDKKVTEIESIQKSKEKKVCLDSQKSFDEETSKLNLRETNTTPNSYKSLSQPSSIISIISKPKNHENVFDEIRSADCNTLPQIKHHKTDLNDKCGKQNKDYNKNHTIFQQQKTGAELNHQYNKANKDYYQKDPRHYNQQRNESQHHYSTRNKYSYQQNYKHQQQQTYGDYSKTNKDYIQLDSKHYNQQQNETKTQHHYSKKNKDYIQQDYKHSNQQRNETKIQHHYSKINKDYIQQDSKHYNQQRNETKTQHHYSKTNKYYIQQDSKHYNQQRNETKTQHHYSTTNKYSYQQNYKHQQQQTYRDYTDSSIASNHISYKKHTGFSKLSNKCQNYLQTPLTTNRPEAIGSTIRKQKELFFNPSF